MLVGVVLKFGDGSTQDEVRAAVGLSSLLDVPITATFAPGQHDINPFDFMRGDVRTVEE